MAEEFFVVYGQSTGNKSTPEKIQSKHLNTEYQANPEECKFLLAKSNTSGASGREEARKLTQAFFPGDITNTPIVITKTNWEKTSGGGTTNYFVLFTQQSLGRRFTLPFKWTGATGEPEIIEEPNEGNFIKIKGESEEEVKTAIMRHFGGDVTTTPITVVEANWLST